jgi:hypothetical protein
MVASSLLYCISKGVFVIVKGAIDKPNDDTLSPLTLSNRGYNLLKYKSYYPSLLLLKGLSLNLKLLSMELVLITVSKASKLVIELNEISNSFKLGQAVS